MSLGLGLCVLLSTSSFGHFILVEVEKVPVDRLVSNLERAIKKDPTDVNAVVNLARVHGMAYARKTDSAELAKDHEDWGPWFGYTPKNIPFSEVKRTDDKAKQEAAKLHLAKALLGFREAVKLSPENMAARMGLAWTLEQRGEKTTAIKQYRELIEEAWKSEKEMDSLPLNGETVVTEATGYLVPLLDKEKDKDEISRLRARVATLRKLGRPITPIAVPLRAGLRAQDIEDRNASVAFDADGSRSHKTGPGSRGTPAGSCTTRKASVRSPPGCSSSAASRSGSSGTRDTMARRRWTTIAMVSSGAANLPGWPSGTMQPIPASAIPAR